MDKNILKWNYIFQYGYIITSILSGIILLPIYLKYIDSTTLGLWLATGNILAWITMADPGIGDVLQQKIADLNGKKNFKEIGLTIGSGLVSASLILIIAVILGITFFLFLETILGKDLVLFSEIKNAFLISIIATGITFFSFGLSGINQGLHNSKLVAFAYITSNILYLIVNILFLILGFSILSIALANIVKALYLIIFHSLIIIESKQKEIIVTFCFAHFKKFIKIFSFTSVSKTFIAIANNIDLLILARFLPASMITIFEINRKPTKMAQPLIGRYSVALMPTISYAKGADDIGAIQSFLNKRIKYYAHIVLLVSFIFFLTFENLISVWIGNEQYAGSSIAVLLIFIFFFNTIGYFFYNIIYALGDIKTSSLIQIVRSIAIIIFSVVGAFYYGIEGLLFSILIITIIMDFIVYIYRLNKLGYLPKEVMVNILSSWLFAIPLGLVLCYIINIFSQDFEFGHLILLIIKIMIFPFIYFILLCFLDKEIRQDIRALLRNQNFLSIYR
ncbi:MAG: lipopolysaccharide biosynthesis protein [Bacteroidota bacterium]|nr:lipopolysaccharide biosynthesis protein [Bacteroidota bacterium]